MDLALKELGLTFILGAIAVLGLEAIVYHFFEEEFTGFLPSLLKRGRQKKAKARTRDGRPMNAAVFVGLAFTVGLLSEDLGYKYVDTAKTPFTYLPGFIVSKLPPSFKRPTDYPDKETSRVETLIKDPWAYNMRVESLTVDLARTHAFSQIEKFSPSEKDAWSIKKDAGTEIETWILANEQCQRMPDAETCLKGVNENRPSNDKITVAVNRLYYYAKNRVYLVRSYYDEMSRIEGRRDFGRSIFLLSVILLIISALIGLGRVALIGLGKMPSFLNWIGLGKMASFLKWKRFKEWAGLRPRLMHSMSICLIFACICGFSFFAFERESDEFNKRAFGYFSAMLYAEQLHKSNPESQEPWTIDAPKSDR